MEKAVEFLMNVANTIPDKGNEIETLEKGSQMYRVHYK
jgi:hypothetical protein